MRKQERLHSQREVYDLWKINYEGLWINLKEK